MRPVVGSCAFQAPLANAHESRIAFNVGLVLSPTILDVFFLKWPHDANSNPKPRGLIAQLSYWFIGARMVEILQLEDKSDARQSLSRARTATLVAWYSHQYTLVVTNEVP